MDDENNALRENFNTFISMAIALFICGVVCYTLYIHLYKQSHMPFMNIISIVILVFFILNLLFILLIKKSGYKNIIEQEET